MYMYSLCFIFNESPWIYEYIHIHQHAAVRGHAKRKFLLIPPSFISNCGWWIAFMWFPIIFFFCCSIQIYLCWGGFLGRAVGRKLIQLGCCLAFLPRCRHHSEGLCSAVPEKPSCLWRRFWGVPTSPHPDFPLAGCAVEQPVNGEHGAAAKTGMKSLFLAAEQKIGAKICECLVEPGKCALC